MGMYLDKGNAGFQSVLNSDFVDKSGVLNILNKSIDTENRFICVSRPRRFGKSVAAKMAYAYYDRKSDSRKQFENLEISKSPDYEKFLNKYPTIYIDFNDFAHINKKEVITKFQKIVITDLKKSYPDLKEENNLKFALDEIHDTTGDKFVLIIDEWDMNIREVEKDVQTEYVNFLRAMFKSINALEVFALVYMTGILPILKIEAQSALNNFREFSMINPGRTAKYYGFTEMEVKKLCETHNMDLALMKHAYDGYIIGDEPSMFNPNSVMQSISNGNYISYWSKSASYTTIEPYIKFDDGTDSVRQKVIRMLNGEAVQIEPASFRNNMKRIESSDDVFTLLAHLGYLSYNPNTQCVMIPNTEIATEFRNSIRDAGWGEISRAVGLSNDLVERTIAMDTEYIAEAFDQYRFEASSILKYNNENSMACAITLAYYAAKSNYKIFREMPAGKGFADMVFVPVKPIFPAFVIELKYNRSVDTAINQIKAKNYPECLKGFSEKIILVGISYSKRKAKHTVKLEVV